MRIALTTEIPLNHRIRLTSNQQQEIAPIGYANFPKRHGPLEK